MNILSAGQGQALAVASGKQFGLTQIAASPHRTNGVVDTFDRQTESRSAAYISYGAAADLAAGFEQFGAGGAVYGAIYTTTAQEPLVGCVDDYIYVQPSDITEVYFDHSIYSSRGTTVQLRNVAHAL